MRRISFLTAALLYAANSYGVESSCLTTLSLDWKDADSVLVTGDFSSWAGSEAEGAVAMSRNDKGIWTTTFAAPAGQSTYKYIIDGVQWVLDPQNPFSADDGFGGQNSVLRCESLPIRETQCGKPDEFDWRDTVMYFAMVDRFFDSDGQASPVDGVTSFGRDSASAQYEGGDLPGVTEKIP